MAKKRRTSAAKTARRRPKPVPRVTTRRVPSSAAARRRSTRAKPSPAARSGPPPETLQVTLELRDVSDKLIRDPETFFTFRRVSDRRQIGDQIAMELTGSAATFQIPVAASEVVVCELDTKRFRFAHSPVFFRTPGPPITRQATLLREPDEWLPRFTRWDDLPGAFAQFKEVLEASPGVTLFKGTEPIADLLTGAAYDGMAGDAIRIAKTALLNIHYRLNAAMEPVSTTRSWFSFVRQIIAIGRERFLAFAKPEMETLVRHIHDNIGEFRADYERTPAENHRGNVPAALQGRIVSMISIKSSHDQGNFQLTLTRLSGTDDVLIDVDIDENGQLLKHFVDLFKHKINGGTHPHDIHEILVLQNGKLTELELGYKLV